MIIFFIIRSKYIYIYIYIYFVCVSEIQTQIIYLMIKNLKIHNTLQKLFIMMRGHSSNTRANNFSYSAPINTTQLILIKFFHITF